MPFYTGGVNLNDFFFTDEDLVNQYIGGLLWSSGFQYNLGDNANARQSSPVQTITKGTNWKSVSAGYWFSAGIKTDGSLWTWGTNNNGGLGDNTTIIRSSPVQVVSRSGPWKSVSCGYYYAGGVKSDGTLWMWGLNTSGQLGDDTVISKSSPVQTIAGGTNWKQISLGQVHTAAIKTDGTLWTWGGGGLGALGDNSTTSRSSPVQTIAGGTNWKQVSCGRNPNTAAVKTDGTLWIWGRGAEGQLGNNTRTVSVSSPVQTITKSFDWAQVACGYYHIGAIKTDGTLWTWGLNNYGQLGTNSGVPRSSPVQTVAGGTNWKELGTHHGLHNVAVKTDGTLWVWGRNQQGQLGDNTLINKSSPVQTVMYGSNWKQASGGALASHFIQND